MAVDLVYETRGEIPECIHKGDWVAVGPAGRIIASMGDIKKFTYFRSAAKPIQALEVILSGAYSNFSFTKPEIALMCASNYAEPKHLQVLNSILQKLKLESNSLKCGPSKPLFAKYFGKNPKVPEHASNIYSDCTGKHAGMLAVCLQKGYPLSSYLNQSHPLQKKIKNLISSVCKYPAEKIITGIDGCGVSVFALPIYNMALGYAKIACPENLQPRFRQPAEIIYNAMIENPFMVSGTDGFCTDLMKHTNGRMIAKIGAAGIYCVGVKDKKMGIALKIENGNTKVIPPVIMQILTKLKLIDKTESENLGRWFELENYNDFGQSVGKLVAINNS